MFHIRVCASHIILPYRIGCYQVYKMENRSVMGRKDEIRDNMKYRSLVSGSDTISDPVTTKPCPTM